MKGNQMKNAAGDTNCDEYISKELEEAQISYERMDLFKQSNGEVPSAIIGFLDGWKFRRAWYYWIAEAKGTLLLFEFADELHQKFGKDVRVSGHCAAPAPRAWCSKPWQMGVDFYHVDTQEGLNALAEAIRKQTESNKVRNLK
jgi:hypothetical protein